MRPDPAIALRALEAIGDGSDEKLAPCPKVRASLPIAIADDPRFHRTVKPDQEIDLFDARALKCSACGEGWICEDRDDVEATWLGWAVWNALHAIGWLT